MNAVPVVPGVTGSIPACETSEEDIPSVGLDSASERPMGAQKPQLTMEAALYGLLALCALAVRLTALGRWPLLPEEVPTALAATHALAGQGPLAHGYLPLLFDAQLLLLSLKSSPFAARLFTALVGSWLVILPYCARGWLGRYGALTVAALMALSPTWVYAGRTADGAAVSIGLGVLGLVLLAGPQDRLCPRRARVGAASLGLALASGPQVVGVLLTLAIVGAIAWQRISGDSRKEWRERWLTSRPWSLVGQSAYRLDSRRDSLPVESGWAGGGGRHHRRVVRRVASGRGRAHPPFASGVCDL